MSSGPSGADATSCAITAPSSVSRPRSEEIRSVRKYDGHTTLAVTPYAASSCPVVSVSATTAALTALYDAIPAGCTSPASEATFTTCPDRCALKSGAKVLVPCTAP